ncbi:MAG: cyclase family protein [Aureliella sp.]
MRVVDLSLPIDANMPGVEISTARKLGVDGWNATTLELYSHCGTHMDAPFHFLPGGATLEKQDLAVCVGEALVLNLAPSTPSQLICVDDVDRYAGRIGSGSRLLFRTDWHKKYGTDEYRSGLPRISLKLANWLVERQVAMIGVEGPSVADVNNMTELTDVHQTLFRGNVLIVEALANLDQLSQEVVQFIALPMKVVGGDGSPVRAIAIE